MLRVAAALFVVLLAPPALAVEPVRPFVSARVETAAGSAPRVPGQEAVPSVAFEFVPAVGARIAGPRSLLTVDGGPRLYYRLPAYEELGRPIILVRGGLVHRLTLDPRWTWNSSAYVSYGEVDYTASATTLNSRLTANITSPVLQVFTTSGQTDLIWQDTERTDWDFGAVASYWQPLGSETDIETSLGVGGSVRRGWQLDARRKLSVPVGVRYYLLSESPSVLQTSAGLGYNESLDRRTNLELLAGASYVLQGSSPSWAPEASVALDRVLHEQGSTRVSNRIATFVRSTFDPSIGRIYPVGGVDLSLRNDLPRDWALTFWLRGSTAITKRPLGPNYADTVALGSVVLTHRLNRWLDFVLGTRGAIRATHFNAERFHLFDRELWGFVGLSALMDLTSERSP